MLMIQCFSDLYHLFKNDTFMISNSPNLDKNWYLNTNCKHNI